MRLRGRWAWVPLAVVPAILVACGTASPSSDGSTPASASPPGEAVAESTPRGPAAFLGPVRRIPVNGITIGYRQVGSGRPLVMIMGFDGTMSMWQYQLVESLVAGGFAVTMFDNRGVGYSTDNTAEPMTIQLMAADTAALIQALGVDRPTVVGWSMGGEIALTLAGSNPDLPGAIVTSGGDAGSRNYSPPTRAAQRVLEHPTDEALMALLFPDVRSQAAADFVSSIELYPSEEVSPTTLARQLEAEDAFSEYPGAWDRLAAIKVPAVIENGALDQVTVPVNARRLAARIPGSRLEIFDAAAHGSLFQDIPRFTALVQWAAVGR